MTEPEIDPGLGERHRIERAIRDDALHSGSFWLYSLAILILAAAAIGGGAMVVHQVCGVNPYDSSLTDCSSGGSTNPLRTAGIAVILGGVVQAILITVLGRVCAVVGTMRATLNPPPVSTSATAATQTHLVERAEEGISGQELDCRSKPAAGSPPRPTPQHPR